MAFSHSTSRLGRRITPTLAANPVGGAGNAVPKADEWLTLAEAREVLELKRTDPGIKALWERIAAGAAANVATVLDGVAIRTALCATKGGDQWCVHRRHVPILGNNLAQPAPAPVRERLAVMPRQSGWLTLTRVADALGMPSNDARLRKAWRDMIEMAEAGDGVASKGIPVRFEYQGLRGVNSWCLHRDDLRFLSATLDRSEPRQTRPAGWLTKEEAFAQHGDGVEVSVFFEAWRTLATQSRAAKAPAALGVATRMELHIVGNCERWLMPAAAAAALAEAARGIPARPVNKFLPMRTILSKVTSDAKPVASRMLAAMARSERRVASPDGGEVVGFKMLPVDGRDTPCMRADFLPAFIEEVRERNDALLVEAADNGSRWDIMADLPDRRLGM